jgi:hypothetical protein
MGGSKMATKKIGKILAIQFGLGGYQYAQFGVTFTLGGKDWAVVDFIGAWSGIRSNDAKWTEEDRIKFFGNMCLNIASQLTTSNKKDLYELVNIPVEATFDDNQILFKWRILSKAL